MRSRLDTLVGLEAELDGLDSGPRALLERIGQACAQRRVGFTLVTLTTAHALDLMVRDRAMRQEINGMRTSLAGPELDSLDLVGPLAAAYHARGAALERPHGHWSAEGNRLIAGWIAASLAGGASSEGR